MALSIDWSRRIDLWCEAVRERVMTSLSELPVEFAPTMEHLAAAAARKLPFKPIRRGRKWGRKWQYGWFRCKVRLPRAKAGRPVVLAAKVGSPEVEMLVFVNGVVVSGLDRWHDHVDLTALAPAGKTLNILIEAYAGHGHPVSRCAFLTPGRQSVPEPPALQQAFEGIRLCEWNEPAYQLWMDAETLRGLMHGVRRDSLRQVRIGKTLSEASCAVDPEAPTEQFDREAGKARKLLAPALAAINGTTAPEMYCFGHAHIDVAWLWPLAQTYRKNAHTFSTALALMEKYREYRFLQSQAQLYDYVKAQYPDVYARIRKAVRRGQWIVEGGMWVEADTNISGGEGLIRQFLYGKEFFRR
ncbi:hypothetical protein LCGC14_2396560, partial [marine sediment metagenome]